MPTDAPERPKLRPGLAAERTPDGVRLSDPYRVGDMLHLAPLGVEIAVRFDGTRTAAAVQSQLKAVAGGAVVPLDAIAGLAAALDEALLLDSPRFAAAVDALAASPVRPMSSLPDDPAVVTGELDRVFAGVGRPGDPSPSPHGRLRAVLAPHMDYRRGGVTYGHAFKELVEHSDATVFVVVGTSHYSPHRFTLTRQDFATPFGVVPTDREYVDRLEREYGPGLFADRLAHVPEHAIELEVVLLQHLLGGRRPFRIVPLLVGSFGDRVRSGKRPADAADVGRMVRALRTAEAACPDPVCYLISGDLAHVGPKFDDPDPVDRAQLAASRSQDDLLLDRLAAADPGGYFDVVAAEDDARRICGLPPTVLTLEAIRPRSGRVLHYQQYVHPKGFESVSFAAAAFYT